MRYDCSVFSFYINSFALENWSLSSDLVSMPIDVRLNMNVSAICSLSLAFLTNDNAAVNFSFSFVMICRYSVVIFDYEFCSFALFSINCAA